MNTVASKLVSVGSSQGVRIPKAFIKLYQFEKDIVLIPQKQGILISPNSRPRQDQWKQYAEAIAAGYLPDTEEEYGNNSSTPFWNTAHQTWPNDGQRDKENKTLHYP